jgi:hypothetical protein
MRPSLHGHDLLQAVPAASKHQKAAENQWQAPHAGAYREAAGNRQSCIDLKFILDKLNSTQKWGISMQQPRLAYPLQQGTNQ